MSQLLIGTVLEVDEHPGARAPSLLLTTDLGPRGTLNVVLPTGFYQPAERSRLLGWVPRSEGR